MAILTAISPAPWRRAARRARHQKRQRKTDPARDQHRTERVVLHLLRHRLRAVTESVAAVLISVFGVADGGIRSFARSILGLAVYVLRRACRLTDAACCLGLCGAGDIADGALNPSEILRRAGKSILVHG